MAVLYPPAQPSLSGDVLTISRFLNSPTLVARRLRTLAEQRFISDVLLSGRIATTSGSVLYETGESIYSDRAPKSVAPGAEYPLTPISTGDASLAKTVKWGNDAEVTDESIARQMFSPVDKAMTKLVNQTVKTVDGVAMSAIHSAVSQNTACIATWTGGGSTPQILRDIARARGKIDALNQGYDPDYLVVDDATYANLVSDASVAALLRRENGANPVYTGTFPVIDGLTVLRCPNLTNAGTTSAYALIVDSKALGSMVDENLGGPGYVSSDGVGIQAKTIREDKNDKWRLRCRRVTVPIVQEPAAAWKITGVAAAS
ncbi:MAG TPA: hypothetical protein PL146_15630 [Mycobacterium sp.]|nr:hypothetical protein [Mycobacterium sp.]HNM85353.1 hypothetical protein [Mycobacterium sp.]